MNRNAVDALARLTRPTRAVVIARACEMVFTAMDRQQRRRGLPLACPFASCYWEAPKIRVSATMKNALREHLIAAHATALQIMEDAG